jgi:hypothetical protein
MRRCLTGKRFGWWGECSHQTVEAITPIIFAKFIARRNRDFRQIFVGVWRRTPLDYPFESVRTQREFRIYFGRPVFRSLRNGRCESPIAN